MKNLSVINIVDKNKIEGGSPWIVLLKIDVIDPASGLVAETMLFARNNEDITYKGDTYVASYFDIELKAEAGATSPVKLVVHDLTRAVQARMQEYGGGVGSNVQVTVINADNLDAPPEVTEFFQVTGASSANYVVTFDLGAENPLMRQFPRRRQLRDFCAWRYKSGECGYTGDMPSCDLTLNGSNGCKAHNNTLNFGGFPGIVNSGTRYG